MFIVCLSGRAGNLRDAKKLLIVCLFGRARKFKRNEKSCLLFVYLAWPGSLKERQKVVYCLFIRQGQKVQKKGKKGVYSLFIRQGQKVKKKGKRLFIVCLSSRAGKVKRGQTLLIVYSSCRAGKFKRKAKSCLLFVYQAV